MHALEEIRRILVPEGILIDLRPVADRWPVELSSDRAVRKLGWITDLPTGLADDEAANNAFKEIARRGTFVCESNEYFRFFYYWDTPEEMREHIQEKWADFMKLEEDSYSAVQNAWATAGADRRVRVRLKMLLARWRKR